MSAASGDESGDGDHHVATGWRQTNAVRSGGVQRVRHKGREYLRFQMVPLVEMVYEYPEEGTREYLPAEHIAETHSLWDGVSLTYVHPKNREKTVRDPDVYAGNVIGAVHNPEMIDGALRVNGIIDIQKAKDFGGWAEAVVNALLAGKEVSVSAGYGMSGDKTQHQSGRFEGEAYGIIQGPPLPDHVAIFPSDADVTARCTPSDGCAAPRANGTANENDTTSESTPMSKTESDTNDANSDEEVEIAELRQELAEIQAMVADLLNSESGKAAAQPQTNAEACECGQSHANYSAVPGQMERDLGRDRNRNREDAEAYPAGGRKAWERRQVGLDDVPDDSDDYPAGGRSNWENRKQRARTNVEQAAAETPMSAAARRSASARQNRMEPSEVAAADYPLTALRKQQERAEKQERWNRLKEQARRNDPNTTAARTCRNSSDGSQ